MTMRASLIIKAVDQASGPFARIAAGARQMSESARDVAAAGGAASRGLDKMTTSATAAAAPAARIATGAHRATESVRGVAIASGMAARGLDRMSSSVVGASGPFARVAAGARRIGESARGMLTGTGAAARGMDRMRAAASSLASRLEFAAVASVSFAGTFGMLAIEHAAFRVGSAIGSVIRGLVTFTTTIAQIGVATAAAAASFAVVDIVRTGAQFENFEAQLRTITGSASAAKQSLAWVQKFAQDTPYELAEVTEAFVALKQRAIDPTDGSLRILGDTAAALNTPIKQAVDMMADAMTFQFERLREYGITANQAGEQVTLNWVKNGKAMTQTVHKDAVTVKNSLNSILNDLYGGSMDAKSKTFDGIMANLKDQWTGFMKMIADAGIFAKIKDALQGLLEKVNTLSKSGQLQAWAKQISDALSVMFDKAVKFITDTNWKAVATDMGSIVLVLADIVGWIGKAASAWLNWRAEVQRQNDTAIANGANAVSLGGVRLWGFTAQEKKDAQARLTGGRAAPPSLRTRSVAPIPSGQGPLRPGAQSDVTVPWGSGRGPLRPGAQAAPDAIWNRPSRGPVKPVSNAAPRPIAANVAPRPLARQVCPAPVVGMARAAPPVEGKVKVDLTVNAAPDTQVRTTRVESSSRNVPISVRTGRAMTGPPLS